MTPLSVYLPFNRDCLRGEFTPAKDGVTPPEPRGRWLIVQEQALVVVPEESAVRLPEGEAPKGFGEALGRAHWLGWWAGVPCWIAGLDRKSVV